MDSEIKNIRLKFNCDADWNSMNPADGGRHCNSCNKTVYDFTDAKPYEFLQILAEQNNKICGRFKTEQMTSEPIHMPAWKKWVSAALVLIGINALNNKSYAQGKPLPPKSAFVKNSGSWGTKSIKIAEADNSSQEDIFNGFVVVPTAQFPGGEQAFSKFLAQNIKYKKGSVDEKIIATFNVTKTGSLSGIKIMRGKNVTNIAEVLRVLKLSPKWKPVQLHGKPIETEYTVPITFSH